MSFILDLTAMLPTAFDVVDQSLFTTENMTAVMRGQVSNYGDFQHSQQRLDRIVVSCSRIEPYLMVFSNLS